MKKDLTKEQLKEALNQLVDMIYEKQGEIDLTEKAVERLISKTSVKDLTRPKTSSHEIKKPPFISRKGKTIYHVDLDRMKDLVDEIVDENYPDDLSYAVNILIGTFDSKGNRESFKIGNPGIMTSEQFKEIGKVAEYLGWDADIVRVNA